MADKPISALPMASSLHHTARFVIEQGGKAMQVTPEEIQECILENGSTGLVVTANVSTMLADTTSEQIVDAMRANKTIQMYLTNSDHTIRRAAAFAGVDLAANQVEHIALFYAREQTADGTWKYTTYIVGANGSMSVYDTDEVLSASKPSTVSGSGRLKLLYTPADPKHAVSKEYVDSVISNIPGKVQSVNGKTGDVTLEASDVGALSASTRIPTKTSDLDNDAGFITVKAIPEAPVQSVNGKTGNVVLDASDVGALSDNTHIPTKVSELDNDAAFITIDDVPKAPVQSVNGRIGDVVVREVPGYASADPTTVLTKFSDGTIGWAFPQKLPEPSLEAVEQWVASLDPDTFNALNQIYNYFVDHEYWDENIDGDIRYFYSAWNNAIRTGEALNELKRSAAVGDTNKIAMLLNGKWQVVVPPYVTAQTAPVRSVNGKTGVVTIDIPTVPRTEITANTAARHTHSNKVTLDAIPNYSSAKTGQTLVKTADGLSWETVNMVPSADTASLWSTLMKTGDGNTYNWRQLNGLALRLTCDTAFIDSDPDLAEVYSNIYGFNTADDIGAAIENGRIGTVELYDVGNSTRVVYGLHTLTYDLSTKHYSLTFAHVEETQIRFATLSGTERVPYFYTRSFNAIPAVTAEDEGKILKVVNGVPTWVSSE